MAIPFVVDEERENEEILFQQLLGELCQTLRNIREAQRARMLQTYNYRPRVVWAQPATELSTHRVDAENRFPPIAVNVGLSFSQFGPHHDAGIIQNPTASGNNNRGRRPRAEASNYQDSKPVKILVSVEVTNKEWTKQEQTVSTSQTPNSGSTGILSKLIPLPLGGPIWTAVICVVGWHLLRSR